MIETLHCLHCNAILRRVNLARLRHIELPCGECGLWSTFDYDPADYVYKTDADVDEEPGERVDD